MTRRIVDSKWINGRPTTAYETVTALFLTYYLVTNLSSIRARPAVIDQAIASVAQVAFPISIAAGFFVAISMRATGLSGILARSVDGSGRFLARWAATYAAIATSAIGVVYVAWALSAGSYQGGWDRATYILVSPAYVLAGTGLGLLAGWFCGSLWQPKGLATAHILSCSLGIISFFGVLFFAGRLPDTSPANLTLSSEVMRVGISVEPRILLSQVGWAACTGTVAISMVLLLGSRRRAMVGGAAVPLVVMVIGALLFATQDLPQRTYRVSTDTECLGAGPVVCFFPGERAGAQHLAEALEPLVEIAPDGTLPERITESRSPGLTRPGTVAVARMPQDADSATTFAAEIVFKTAGCEAADVGASRELIGLLTDLKTWLSASRTQRTGDGPADTTQLQQALATLGDRC